MDPIDRAALLERIAAGETFDYLLFYGHTVPSHGHVGPTCLSQWYPARFLVDGERFLTAEHWMMAGKARLFGDEATRARILAAGSPGEAKRLGRSVTPFDEERWEAARFELVVRGNVAKFGADPRLEAFLVGTGRRVLVEASPRDRIWGIGLGARDPAARDPARWRGENLLGFALMAARAALSP